MQALFIEKLKVLYENGFTILENESIRINQKINLFSKPTEQYFTRRHIDHSLSILKRHFPAGSTVVDWGTGGGFPGLPLAISCPDCDFYLVDAVSKKIQAVRSVARRIGLTNVTALHQRAETFNRPIHYSVSRATAPLRTLWQWHQAAVQPFPEDVLDTCWPQGLYCLKGGDLTSEIAQLQAYAPHVSISQLDLHVLLGDSYFDKKYIVSVTENP